MKHFFLIFFLIPFIAQAQPYVLLDRGMKMPVELKSELEAQKIAPFYFPVHQQDLDAMIEAVDHYIKFFDRLQNPEINENIQLGNSRMRINYRNEKDAKGFCIYLTTRAKDCGFSLELVGKNDTRRRGLQKMKAFLYYLRNNRFLVNEPSTVNKQ